LLSIAVTPPIAAIRNRAPVARRRRGRPLDGILVLNKAGGMTSNAALQTARRIFEAEKAGHTGSLDPLATGVLPLCFGEATKFSQYLLDADKIYRSTFVLGTTTDSGDADGEVLAECDASALTEPQVEAALARFRGAIEQVPSMFSALKKDGQPLYKLARAGIEVERAPRSVIIFELRIEAFRPGAKAEVDVWVHCSKGTYVRSIAEDLGRALGCGAHVAKLHRVQAGPFKEADAVSLDALEALKEAGSLDALDRLLQPASTALYGLPLLRLSESAGFYLRQGQPVMVADAKPQPGSLVQLEMAGGGLLGVGEILEDGRVAPRRLVNQQSQTAGDNPAR
jgi:tRNA pseudouridine55 synthase